MAITLTRVFGPVNLPSGEVPAHGRIRFALRDWDRDGDTVIPAAAIEAVLDAQGGLDAQLWASLSGARHLTYGVEVTWWSPALRALAHQTLPDIAVPGGADIKLKDLLTIPPTASNAPDLLVQAAGFAAAAEAAADSAVTLASQAIDLLALGAPGVFASTAAGIAATGVGDFFSVASNLDDTFLILYRHDTGGIATEIARYPTAASLGSGGGGDGGSTARIPPEGETARLDFALGAGSIRGGVKDATGLPATLGTFRALEVPRLYRRSDALLGLTEAGALRRNWPGEGFAGGLFEPAATLWAPLAPIGAGADWTTIGVTLADTTDLSPVEGARPRSVSAAAGGAADRGIGIPGIALTLDWYQLDVVLRTGAATAVMLRMASEFGNPAFGGGGWTVHVNLVTGTVLRSDAAGRVDAAPVFLRKLAPDTWHVRIRARPAAISATETFWIYAKSTDDLNRSSSFTAGVALFTLAHLSVQRSAAPRAPAAPVGMNVPVPAESLTLDAKAINGDRRTGTFEVHFRLADDFPEDATTITPVWKIAAAADPANRGIGIEIAGRAIAAVINTGAGEKKVQLRDLFAREFRVALSYDNETLRLAVNGATVAAIVGADTFENQWETLFLGDFNPILAGAARPFSGTIGFWRYFPQPLAEGALARLTRPLRPLAPGESAPAIVEATGRAVLSLDGAGRIEFTPGRQTLATQQSVLDPDGSLPADALATRLMVNGDLQFLSQSYGAPFGAREQRARRMAGEDGLIIGARADLRFEALWGNGQSLMYAFTYGQPVNWPDHPWFLDIDDGLFNSVFGFSTLGFATDRLRYPIISQDPVGGAGGMIYPAAHTLARLTAAREAAPPPLIAKSIGQSGEQIAGLWPWGVFEADGVTPKPGRNPQHWINVRRWHQSAVDAVTRLGGTVTMPVHVWGHGTADDTNPHYYADMLLARADLDAITTEFFGPFGQTTPPLWVMTQSGARVDTSANPWPVKMDQLRFAEDQPGAILAAPFSAPDMTIATADQNVHPDYASTTRIGELIGHAIAEVRAGRRWTIGRPAIIRAAAEIILDYAAWLRPGERLVVAPDTFYGGVGIGPGAGFEVVQVVNTGTTGVARWGGPAANVLGIEVMPTGTACKVTLDAAPTGPQGIEMRYAYQTQNMSVADPLHYAHRGLLRTDWGAPSAILPGAMLRRWLPSWKEEFLN
jgi:hypothetical protein